MNIFYTAASGGSNAEIQNLVTVEIPSLLRQAGNEVYVAHYDPENPSNNDGFDDVARAIVRSDIFIGEMSRASQTLGFQLSYALHNTKPALYLYHVSTKAKPGSALTDNPSRLLKIKSYDGLSLKHVLDDFLKQATEQLNSVRTSFMSTRRIDAYVSERSKLFGVTKAEVIRQILDDAIDA